MFKNLFKVTALIAIFGLFQFCGDGVEVTQPEPEPTQNRLECKVNGKDWSASTIFSLDTFGLFQVNGSVNLDVLQINLFDNELAPGSYDLSSLPPAVVIQFIGLGDGFNSEASGQVELLVNNSNLIAGRFNVRLKSLATGNTVELTRGEFLYEKR
jgi:hypothetical protein